MDTISVTWTKAALDAIRHLGAAGAPADRPRIGPPMVARSLAILHTAIYDAWAVYDATALPTRLRVLRRSSGTDAERIHAMSQAALVVLKDQFPSESVGFDELFKDLGYLQSESTNGTQPDGIGNLAAAAILEDRHSDGSNQNGVVYNGKAGPVYGDTTGYGPHNPPMLVTVAASPADIAAPARWQPLGYADGGGVVRIPGFIGPQWQNVRPFALTSAAQFRPGPPAALNSQAFLDQARHVVEVQQQLSTKQKVIAEYWADGPSSELPPGHWELFAAYVSQRDSHTLHDDARMFFAVANAIHDAAIATWECKRTYDYARPVTTIRHLCRGKSLQGWDGATMATLDGAAWRPYQVSTFPTPPFPEYTSGHSAFSMAAAEALKRFTGSDAFGDTYIQPGPLRVEPGLAAATGTELHWSTFSEAAQEAGESRLYGGIHFYEGNVAGLELGRRCGAQAFDLAQRHWDGQM